MNDSIVKEHIFDHPIADVWKAITDEREISEWFIQADFKPEKGYQYTFTHDPEGEDCTQITGEVLEASPMHTLVYTWIVKGTETITTVSWKLSEKEGQTHLYLEHSGISQYPSATAVKMFESFSGGWNNCIVELEKYLKTAVHA